MHHIIFKENTKYTVAILIKESAFNKDDLIKYYLNNFTTPQENVIAFTLKYNDAGKAPAKLAKDYLDTLLKPLEQLGVEVLLVCDSAYYKFLTGVRKVEGSLGYVKPCVIKNYEHMKVVLCPNYKSVFYNPRTEDNIKLAIKALNSQVSGVPLNIGQNIIHTADYPETYQEVEYALNTLHAFPEISCDVETLSLKFYDTSISTIAFAPNKHEGACFLVDYEENKELVNPDVPDIYYYGRYKDNPKIRELLKNFFLTYKGKITYHNANFDMKIIINSLFMKDLLDTEGMLHGIDVLTKNFDDTKLLSYLATNSTAGNKLSLKYQAHEFAGDYAQDEDKIKNIRLVPNNELKKYNLTDCLATNYVKEKHFPTVIADNQLDIYNNIFKPSVKAILQMELTGAPIDMEQVYIAKEELEIIQNTSLAAILPSAYVLSTKELLDLRFINKDYRDRKNKAKFPDKIKPKLIENIDVTFNVNSTTHLSILLYEVIGLPVIDTTDKGAPATGAKTLKKLVNHTNRQDVIELLQNLITYGQAAKITSTFIKAFIENSVLKSDGVYYLHGSYNLGGTVSGRMSSSQPNMQNLPSGSTYAKIIKKCFIAPPGYVMAGADFDSLEDKVSALTTKDVNKLKVYTDGYCGHCLRAYSYFKNEMPDIINTVESINSIAIKYPKLRQKSKAPTFLLTYGGTYYGIVMNLGVEEDEAKAIESNYHALYEQSDTWVRERLLQASKVGYVDVAFGLRVRTPILSQTILDTKSTPYEARQEGRTAGNAMGQSYGLLNNRASIEFQERVLASPYRHDIKPIMQIHDAMYFIIKDDINVIKWFNDNLVECMEWQELPELFHEQVKLSGAVDVFYPDWNSPIGIPNKATKEDILNIAEKVK